MLDPKLLRDDLTNICQQLKRLGFEFAVEKFNELETGRKKLQVRTEELQHQRNANSKAIGKAKAQGQDIAPLLQKVNKLGEELKQEEHRLQELQTELHEYLLTVPNLADPDVPQGNDEADNEIISHWGEARQFDFTPKITKL